jgi:uncharacterized protein YigE (DUF2233 family)
VAFPIAEDMRLAFCFPNPPCSSYPKMEQSFPIPVITTIKINYSFSKAFAMRPISQKKIVISFLVSTSVIFTVSAIGNALGIFGYDTNSITRQMSVEFMMVIQLLIVLIANSILHFMFYYGGINSSPITKGIGIGTVLGIVYFLVSVFALNLYDFNAPLQHLVEAMSGRIIEYGSGGIATAFVSVSNIHKWGLLKAI